VLEKRRDYISVWINVAVYLYIQQQYGRSSSVRNKEMKPNHRRYILLLNELFVADSIRFDSIVAEKIVFALLLLDYIYIYIYGVSTLTTTKT